MPSDDGGITLLSFNCLRKKYAFRENTWCAAEHRQWDTRRALLERLMTRDLGQLDFLCLQEVEEPELDLPFLDAAFGQVSAIERNSGAHCFTKPRLYYRRAAWTLLWVESRSRVVIGAFRGRHDEVVYVANVHLSGGPSEKAELERQSQIKSALKYLQKRRGSAGENAAAAALIVAGDFNDTEQFRVLTDDMKLVNVMQRAGVRYPSHQWGCTNNGAPNCFQSTIDQIYVRQDGGARARLECAAITNTRAHTQCALPVRGSSQPLHARAVGRGGAARRAQCLPPQRSYAPVCAARARPAAIARVNITLVPRTAFRICQISSSLAAGAACGCWPADRPTRR